MVQGIRWGIIGTAKISRRVIHGIGLSTNSVVHGIASREWTRAREMAKEHGIPRSFGSYEELLASEEIDAVYNPLPNALHAEWTIKALEAGKPVLCEKPFGANAEDARAMAEAAERTGLPLAEAFMYRFHPLYDSVRTLIQRGDIGELVSINSAFSFHLESRKNIRTSQELAGGALMDVGCYCVSMSRLIVGEEPTRVAAYERRSTVDDTMQGIMEFPSGVLAQFECSFETDFRSEATISGTEGTVSIPNFFRPAEEGIFTLKRGDDEKIMRVPGADCYKLEVEDFANACKTRQAPRWCPKDAVANMTVLDALYEAARTGSKVALA